MKYYRLLDDVNIKGRWHLGELTEHGGSSSINLWHGVALNERIGIQAEITDVGTPLEFCLSSFGVPIAKKRLALAIREAAGGDLQLLHVDIPGCLDFYALNCVRIVDCLDEGKSEFVKWTKADHRSDLAGEYRMVTKLIVDPIRIPSHAHFFRIKGWTIALIVSERIKTAMELCGSFGAKFLNSTSQP